MKIEGSGVQANSVHRLTLMMAMIFGLISFFVIVYPVHTRFLRGQNDFVGLYVGGIQMGTSDLYSYSANQHLITQLIHGIQVGTAFVRPPFYAVLIHPLVLLPSYSVSYCVFMLLMLAAFVWFLWRFSRECRELPVFAMLTPAVLVAFSVAQDSALILAVAAASILLFRSGRHFVAGLVLSLCAIKFHLFILIPVLLLIRKRWSALSGLAAGGSALVALGAIFAGVNSYYDWIKMLRNPALSRGCNNIHSLVEVLRGNVSEEITLVLTIVILFIWMCWKTDDFEFLFGIALILGLLINAHSYSYDGVLLLLAFVLIKDKRVRIVLGIFLLTPVAHFLLFGPSPVPYTIATLVVFMVATATLLFKPLGRPQPHMGLPNV